MSMTKLIITGGCSMGDQECSDYKTEGGVTVWPTLVNEITGTEVLNISKQSMSNDYIENVMFDAILENKDKYDITVLLYWTELQRINIFDQDTDFQYTDRHAPNPLSFYGFDEKTAVKQSFRNIRRTQTICDAFNIPCYHRLAFGLTGNTSCSGEELGINAMIEEFNLSYFELYSGRWSNRHNDNIAQNQLHGGHPNQQMQYEIAHMFIETMNGNELFELEKPSEMPVRGFVYD